MLKKVWIYLEDSNLVQGLSFGDCPRHSTIEHLTQVKFGSTFVVFIVIMSELLNSTLVFIEPDNLRIIFSCLFMR